jgi:hypothetical protein
MGKINGKMRENEIAPQIINLVPKRAAKYADYIKKY